MRSRRADGISSCEWTVAFNTTAISFFVLRRQGEGEEEGGVAVRGAAVPVPGPVGGQGAGAVPGLFFDDYVWVQFYNN
jgi:hypothetical protein